LGLGGCSFACGASACCLSASLCDFLCVVFCILLSWVAEGGSGGVLAEYGRFLQAFLIWQSSALAHTSESWSVFAFVKILDFDVGEHVLIR
jgi:hypothetical protein